MIHIRAKCEGWFAYLLSQLAQFLGFFESVNKYVNGHDLVDFIQKKHLTSSLTPKDFKEM